jgi:hypothetical protein
MNIFSYPKEELLNEKAVWNQEPPAFPQYEFKTGTKHVSPRRVLGRTIEF